jgi:hypothetical protein
VRWRHRSEPEAFDWRKWGEADESPGTAQGRRACAVEHPLFDRPDGLRMAAAVFIK